MKTIVEAPGLRYQLIFGLADFSDPEKQKVEFCSKVRNDRFYVNVNEPIECIFDVPFETSTKVIGVILKDINELSHLRRLGLKLRAMQYWILEDGEQNDSYYMDSPLWKEVTRLAKKAYDVMMLDEDLDSLLEAAQEDFRKNREEEAKKAISTEEEQRRDF